MFTAYFYDKQQCMVAEHEVDCITREAAAFTARLETYDNHFGDNHDYKTFVVRDSDKRIVASGSWMNDIKIF